MRSVQIKWRQATQYIVLALSVTAIALMIASTYHLNRQNLTQIEQQTDLLSHTLVRYAAESVALAVVKDEPEQLQTLLDQLTEDPYVYDAAIYDLSGVQLSQSKGAKSVAELTGLTTPPGTVNLDRKQWVAEINHQGERVGFLRLTLEQEKLVSPARNTLQAHIGSLRFLLVFAVIIGVLLTLAFHPSKRWLRSPFQMRSAVSLTALTFRYKRKATTAAEPTTDLAFDTQQLEKEQSVS